MSGRAQFWAAAHAAEIQNPLTAKVIAAIGLAVVGTGGRISSRRLRAVLDALDIPSDQAAVALADLARRGWVRVLDGGDQVEIMHLPRGAGIAVRWPS